MEVKNTSLLLDASIYGFKKAEDTKSNQILAALGMTPQTQKAEQQFQELIKQATGQGVNLDFKA